MARPKREDGRNARTVASNKYNGAAYDRISVTIRKGEREKIKKHAAGAGESMSGLINRLLASEIQDFEPIGSDKTE